MRKWSICSLGTECRRNISDWGLHTAARNLLEAATGDFKFVPLVSFWCDTLGLLNLRKVFYNVTVCFWGSTK